VPRRSEIVAAARAMLGTPFRHQGRTPGKSLDCAGILRMALLENGIDVPDVVGYSRRPDGITLTRYLNTHFEPLPINEAKDADIIEMCFEKWPQHLGMIASKHGRRTIIHASMQNLKVVEHGLDGEWGGRIVRAFHVPGVLDG